MRLHNYIPTAFFTKKVLKLIIPIAIGQMLIAMVSFVDQFMVGRVDVPDPLTSVLVASEIIYIAMGINLGIALIGDIFAAQFFGAKMVQKLKDVTKLKVFLNLITASLAVGLINIFAIPLINVFIGGQDQQVINQTLSYLRLISIGHMMYTITISFIGSLNTIGKPQYHFFVSLSSLIFNITFNFLFIYVLNFGIDGAAYSTILARFLEMFLILFFVYKNRFKIWFGWKIWKIDWHIFNSMLRRWLIVTSQVMFAIGLATKTAIWTNYYPSLNNAFGIGYAVSGLLWSAFPGFSAAAKIIIGKQMAQNHFERAYNEARKMLFLSILVSLLLGFVIFQFAFWLPQVVGLKDQEVIAARTMIIAESLLLSFIVVGVYIFSLLEAGGFSRASTFLNSYYILIVVCPFALLVSRFWNPSFELAFLLTQIVHFVGVGLISLPFFFRRKWLRNITTSHLKIIV